MMQALSGGLGMGMIGMVDEKSPLFAESGWPISVGF
jgi:hypothetical protein